MRLSLACCTVRRALPWILVLVWSLPSGVRADKYAAEFLKIGAGARPLAMGGAFVALADDASAGYWNPAGLLFLRKGELLLMHAEHLGNLADYDYAAFAQPLAGKGRKTALGISLIRFSVQDILVTRDAYQDLNGNGRYDEGEPVDPDAFRRDSDTEYALLLSYATALREKLYAGANLKLIRQDLVGTTSFGMGVDLGFLYLLNPVWTLGLRLADITTTQISWDTGRREVVNPSGAVGATATLPWKPFDGVLTLALDLEATFENRQEASQFAQGPVGMEVRLGGEYWFRRTLALRAGLQGGDVTAGAGLRYRSFGLDYAFVSRPEFDTTHRLSALVRF
jgi:hypothetical protein